MTPALAENALATVIPPVQNEIRALVLDDSQFDRTKIRRMFRTSGLEFSLDEVETLGSLQQALDQEEFDVILIDYNLPEGNGIEAVKQIQQHSTNSDAAIIMVTGDDQSQIAVKAMKVGCRDYISKGQLSAESLQSSILAAIEGTEFAKSQVYSRTKNIEEVTNLVMAKYSNALQPEIASIVREMRRLKATMANPNSNLPGDLEAIEQQCVHLWAILTMPEELGL
ncbi:response regulator [Litoreibacter sp.]|nr:response regulator [Litoreibacter sp.]